MNSTPTVIRHATAGDLPAIARVHVDSWRTTYRGLVADAYLDGILSYERREAGWRTEFDGMAAAGRFVLVAERDNAIVGFASGGPERGGTTAFPGELEAIYLLAEAQRGGIGRLLVAAVARELALRGWTAMLLWVLEGNAPARAFYERLGGRAVLRQPVTIGGEPFEEIAYGWDDTAPLRGS